MRKFATRNEASFAVRGTRTIVTFGASLSEARYTREFALDNDVLRFTVGRIVVEPNTSNSVANRVSFTIDFRHPDDANREAHGNNPLCGDRLTVYLRLGEDGKIEDAAFEGRGCAISMASASMTFSFRRRASAMSSSLSAPGLTQISGIPFCSSSSRSSYPIAGCT